MSIDERDYMTERHFERGIIFKQRVQMNTGMNYIPKGWLFVVIALFAAGIYLLTKDTPRTPNIPEKPPTTRSSASTMQPPVNPPPPRELPRNPKDAFTTTYRPERDCIEPTSELKRLECKNRLDMARTSFYARPNRPNTDRMSK